MRGGAKPSIRSLDAGDVLTQHRESGDALLLLLDGVLTVEVDGTGWAEVGPGAVLGERAALEEGARTATLRAVTPVRVAAVAATQIDRDKLMQLAAGHRREEQSAG